MAKTKAELRGRPPRERDPVPPESITSKLSGIEAAGMQLLINLLD
ncbi:MAG: hypothetical protein ACR2PH_10470 [Desulfobulbia bacterium]